MKLRIFLFSLLCSFALWSHAQQEERPQPRIYFEQDGLDAGTLSVSKGDKRKLTFQFVNVGNAPLEIQ